MTKRDARSHAQRLVGALSPEVVEQLRSDVFSGLEELGYTLRFRSEPDVPGTCSVAGSFNPGPPPTITVVQSISVRRQRFTALHELGHRMVSEDHALLDVFMDERDRGVALEEGICDAVAAEILLPDHLVDEHIGSDGPTAAGVAALFKASQASREACCVRAAQRIVGEGHVMVAHGGVAQFTASRGTPYRLARNTPQGDGHITVRAAVNGSWRAEEAVRYASGATSKTYFADAVADGDYVFAVFLDARAPWIKGVSLYSGDRINPAESYCGRCDVAFETLAAPCPTCHDYRHTPGCDLCSCEPALRERLCDTCFTRKHEGLFAGGATTCADCLA